MEALREELIEEIKKMDEEELEKILIYIEQLRKETRRDFDG